MYALANKMPVKISIAGYIHEILDLQLRHLPRRKSHENTGIKSKIVNCLLHAGQCDGGRIIDSFLGTRNPTTLKNDPNTRPYRKKNKEISIVIGYLYPSSSWDT